MNPLDEQIEAIEAMLRARGAVVGIDRDAPDYVKRAWLDMILNCPDCKEELRKNNHEKTN